MSNKRAYIERNLEKYIFIKIPSYTDALSLCMTLQRTYMDRSFEKCIPPTEIPLYTYAFHHLCLISVPICNTAF